MASNFLCDAQPGQEVVMTGARGRASGVPGLIGVLRYLARINVCAILPGLLRACMWGASGMESSAMPLAYLASNNLCASGRRPGAIIANRIPGLLAGIMAGTAGPNGKILLLPEDPSTNIIMVATGSGEWQSYVLSHSFVHSQIQAPLVAGPAVTRVTAC